MATTAETIIKAALRKVGDTYPTEENKANALTDLNSMLGQWSAEGLMVPYITTENFTMTVNDREYTIGSGGDFDTTRPVYIQNAYLRDSNGYDDPILQMSKVEYNALVDKTTSGKPERYLYIPSYPLGKIYFDYSPDEAYEFHFDSIKPLSEFTSMTETVNLPSEYNMALIYNLAVIIADDFGSRLPARTLMLAENTKMTLKNNNIEYPPLAEFDNAIARGGYFNIFTGQVR